MNKLVTVAMLFAGYLVFTFYAGYQRGSDIEARMFGATVLGERMAAANAPDWETVSPAFMLGVDTGLGAK